MNNMRLGPVVSSDFLSFFTSIYRSLICDHIVRGLFLLQITIFIFEIRLLLISFNVTLQYSNVLWRFFGTKFFYLQTCILMVLGAEPKVLLILYHYATYHLLIIFKLIAGWHSSFHTIHRWYGIFPLSFVFIFLYIFYNFIRHQKLTKHFCFLSFFFFYWNRVSCLGCP